MNYAHHQIGTYCNVVKLVYNRFEKATLPIYNLILNKVEMLSMK